MLSTPIPSTSHPDTSVTPTAIQPRKLNSATLKNLLHLPRGLVVGKAVNNGGCFFDALAQTLNQIHGTQEYSEKSLRMSCYQYYSDHREQVDEWNKNDHHGIDQGDNYDFIRYTQAELDRDFKGTSPISGPIWGRAHIEGKILCSCLLNILAIHVIELNINPNNNQYIVTHFIITAHDEMQISGQISYDSNTPAIIVNQITLHYDPILFFSLIITDANTAIIPYSPPIPQAIHEAAAFQAVEDGNIDLLRILAYDCYATNKRFCDLKSIIWKHFISDHNFSLLALICHHQIAILMSFIEKNGIASDDKTVLRNKAKLLNALFTDLYEQEIENSVTWFRGNYSHEHAGSVPQQFKDQFNADIETKIPEFRQKVENLLKENKENTEREIAQIEDDASKKFDVKVEITDSNQFLEALIAKINTRFLECNEHRDYFVGDTRTPIMMLHSEEGEKIFTFKKAVDKLIANRQSLPSVYARYSTNY